ncbi:hypothetical protein A0O00_06120 [Proteus mirabilis]|nr:hypothetical protein [Proteus mirabilis]OOQ51425.1 hypothetical protein A0O00_06120 [Proteus mirabilis]HCT1418476.1 hypothetical protein [Proteus mirabilis]
MQNYRIAIVIVPRKNIWKKKLVNIEHEVAALKVILKSLLLTLTNKQKESVIYDINKTIRNAYAEHPQYQDIIEKTEQYIKKILQK